MSLMLLCLMLTSFSVCISDLTLVLDSMWSPFQHHIGIWSQTGLSHLALALASAFY